MGEKKKRKRNKNQKIKQQFTKFKLLYSNINHAKCKIESLTRIINEEKPTVVALVETKLEKGDDLDIEGYKSYPMNRDMHGGGIMILVKEKLEHISTVVEESTEVGEIMWLTLSNGRTNIRLGLIYAPQEKETTVPELKIMHKNITKHLKLARENNQSVLMMGDFNCKIGQTIKSNSENISKGGRLLLETVRKQGLKIANASDKCKGTWTRTDGKKKSILDYIILDRDDEELIKEMVIDEGREITPSHYEGGRKVFTDHYTISLQMNWNMRFKPGMNRRIVMNEESHEEFYQKTDATNLQSIWQSSASPIEKYSIWSKEVSKIADSVYIKKKKKKKELKAVRMLRNRKKEINSNFKEASPEEKKIYIRRRHLINEHIETHQKEQNKRRTVSLANKIKSKKGFDGSAFWEFRRQQTGRRKDVAKSMKNEDGEVTENPEEILKIYQNFYQKLLSGREMKTEDGKQIEQMVDRYIEELIKKAEREPIKPFSEEEYKQMKRSLKNRKAPDIQGWRYELIKYAGEDLEKSTLMMLNELATNMVVAKEWEEMVIKSIGKAKGDQQMMKNKRGLFLTNIVSKVMEKMIKNRTKDKTEEGMSPFQCGGVKQRGIGDNLLLQNTVIEEFRAENKELYLLFADLEKCFDQLWLKDCIKEVVEAGMPAAEAVYIYKMNQKVNAVVETPVGKTEAFQLTEIVKQGTVSAVDLCGVSTDKINKLKSWKIPLKASGVEVKHPAYVDDLIGMGSPEMIIEMEPKMRFLEEAKKFIFNNERGKTELMKMKLSNRIKSEEEEPPRIRVSKGEIGYTEQYKCLGDQYDITGKNSSKILKKMEKVSYISAEVKRQGGYNMVGKADTEVRLLLLETVVKPTLMFNSETWVNVTKEEMKAVDKGHYEAVRKIFEQKKHTPYFGILMEIGCWPYSYVLIYKRLMYFHHIIHSDEKRIIRKVVVNQMNGEGKGKPWFNHGVKEWLVKLDMPIEEEEVIKIKKSSWKRNLKSRIEEIVAEEMKKHQEEMTKLRFTRKFERQEYVKTCSMAKVKKIMSLRLNMTELKANFRGKYDDNLCPACGVEEETTEHVICCPKYQEIIGHGLKTTEGLKESMNSIEWLEEACEVYEQIEESRKWLL